MKINEKLVPAGLGNNPNKAMAAIKYVTIHTTGNRNASANAAMHANYLYSGSAQTSWHYTVDDGEIWRSFEDNRACWHAGDGSGDGNNASVGIEICVNGGAGAFVKACQNAAWLTAELLKKHGLTPANVKQHYDWSKKDCPKELRSGEWGIDWNGFMELIKTEFFKATVLSKTTAPNTPIMGKPQHSADVLAAFLLSKNAAPSINCTAMELAQYFIEEGEREGVRGDIAFCQSLHETNYFKFGNDVKPGQNNFAGLGATGGGNCGLSFPTPQTGVRAQIQHLKAYASIEPFTGACVDPRFGLVKQRGVAPNVEDLTGKWATDSKYAEGILDKCAALRAFAENYNISHGLTAAEKLMTLISGSQINSPDYWRNALKAVKYFDSFISALWEKYEKKRS